MLQNACVVIRCGARREQEASNLGVTYHELIWTFFIVIIKHLDNNVF